MTEQVTIYDIAKAAGVSASTVSRALSKPGRVSVKTEFRIRRIAQELGYLSPTDDAVPATETGFVGAIVPDLRNPFYAQILHGLKTALHSHGLTLTIMETPDSHSDERRAISAFMRGCDALVLISSTMSEPDIKRLSLVRPIITVNRRINGLSCVLADVAPAIDEAVKLLHDTGHHSVSYLAGNYSSQSGELRRRALRSAAYRYDLTFRTIRGFNISLDDGGKAADQYAVRPTDAVFSYNDHLAIGFIHAIRAKGMRVPEDVSVISFDNIAEAAILSPSISSIDQHGERLGVSAATIVAKQLTHANAQTNDEELPAEFIPRDSVSTRKRSTLRLGPYADLAPRNRHTTVLTMLSSSFTEVMPRIEEFMRTHPGIVIDPIEGHTQKATTALYWERMASGRAVPDLFNVEFDKMPQFAAAGALLNLSTPKMEALGARSYAPAAWNAVHYAGGLYGFPGDQSQTVMFYRKDLFDRYGLDVPTTWSEFYEEGVELHRRNPNRYMGMIDTTDAQHYLQFLRMTGAKPWNAPAIDTISFHLDSPEVTDVVTFLQRCLDDGVLTTEPIWDGHNALPEDGKILTLVHANWFGKILATSYPASRGLWKVALPPTFGDPHDIRTAEIGGSMIAVSARIPRDHQMAALKFAHWLQSDPVSVGLRAPGGYSAARIFEEDQRLIETEDPYFRQCIYRTYIDSARRVNRDWDHLPFASYLWKLYDEELVPELKPGGRSPEVIASWQRTLADYARMQGFTVIE